MVYRQQVVTCVVHGVHVIVNDVDGPYGMYVDRWHFGRW
jgi:hypothetical protein